MVLPHGEEIPGRWAIRGSAAALPDSAWMWDAAWDIPPDYPLGKLDYRLVITAKDGRTATFTPPIQKAPTQIRVCGSLTNEGGLKSLPVASGGAVDLS